MFYCYSRLFLGFYISLYIMALKTKHPTPYTTFLFYRCLCRYFAKLASERTESSLSLIAAWYRSCSVP